MTQAPIPPDLIPELERVDRIIAERIAARPVVARVAGRHLGTERGRLYAAIVLLAARLGHDRGEARQSDAAHAAATAAIIHAAASVHDELVDEAERRRGTVAASAHWNGSAALMVGDYLFALASAEMSLAPDPRIIAAYARSVMAICEGQMAPVTALAPLEVAREQYLYRAGCATAALLDASARSGGVCAGLAEEQIEALGRFGFDLGLALQIADDARDYQEGGLALRAGVITLPLIYAADAGAPHLQEALDEPLDSERAAAVLDDVRRRGGDARAWEDARRFAAQAAGHLSGLPPGPARDALAHIAESIRP